MILHGNALSFQFCNDLFLRGFLEVTADIRSMLLMCGTADFFDGVKIKLLKPLFKNPDRHGISNGKIPDGVFFFFRILHGIHAAGNIAQYSVNEAFQIVKAALLGDGHGLVADG